MAARFSRTFRTSGAGNATAALEIVAGAYNGFRLFELGLSLAAATASTYVLGRPAALGITPTTPVGLLRDGAGDAASGTARIAGAWVTGPTVPAAFIRQVSLPATLGAERIWLFASGIWVPAGGSIVLWNGAINGIADVFAVIEE